jgi:N6-L-threonylcarbamoyladenine synthase
MRVLGIETTCDETAAAVVALRPGGGGDILSNEIYSQISEHTPYGGVVPEIAARAHVEKLDGLVRSALLMESPRRRGRGSSAASWWG